MQLRVGCKFQYESPAPTPMLFTVRPGFYEQHRLLDEAYKITPPLAVEDYLDQFGNRVWRLLAPQGPLHIEYDAIVEVESTPDLVLSHLRQSPIQELPYDVLPYTLPSRYCDSDYFLADAWQLFGHVPAG